MEGIQFVLQVAQGLKWSLKIYSWLHIFSILITWVNPDPYNPIVYNINKLTHPLWRWVEDHVTQSLRPMSAYLALLLVYFAEIAVPGVFKAIGALLVGYLPLNESLITSVVYVVVAGLILASEVVGFLAILALIWFVLGIIGSPLNHPIVRSIFLFIDPFLVPIQRLLPRTSVDFSPLVLAALAYFASSALKAPFKYLYVYLSI